MKLYFHISLCLLFFISCVGWSQKPDDTGLCRKTMLLPNGSMVSSLSDLSTSTSILCSVSATTKTAKGEQQLLLDPTGFVHSIDHRGKTANIRSMAFLNSDGDKNQLVSDSDSPQVRQSQLQWVFNKENGSLQAIQTADGKLNCLSTTTSPSSVQIAASKYFNLHACPGMIIADLGVAQTDDHHRETAPLRRDQLATISVSHQGKLLTCKVQIGRLFSYQSGKYETNGKTIIIEKGYDPCYMYATPAFPKLTPVAAIMAFKQANPQHACISMERGTEQDALKYKKLTAIPEGISRLPANINISYAPHSPAVLTFKIKKYGQGKQCSLVADLVAKQSPSVSPSTPSSPQSGRN